MLGTNEVTSAFHNAAGDLLIAEPPFYTLQGEGPDAGRPAIFLRLAKCNLRCYFCDTEFEQGTLIPLSDLVTGINAIAVSTKCRLVVITGGEPLLQNIVPLIKELNSLQIGVSIETAGTVYVEGLNELFKAKRSHSPMGNLIVISPKTTKLNAYTAQICGALKYIINAGELDEYDGLPNRSTQTPGQAMKLFRPISGMMSGVPIYVQAQDTGDDFKSHKNLLLAATIAMEHGYRLSVQLHKLAQLP